LYSTLYERSDQEVITNQGYVFTQWGKYITESLL
jgi:hypothetical protein